jgi:peptidoglycan/xylan/chitin deacetylase (PgdA/CDA1 family)
VNFGLYPTGAVKSSGDTKTLTRFISFRFDDGFYEGALRAHALLAPDRATFFLVTGLVDGTHALEHIPEFRGRDFGNVARWRALADLGHEVQLHSVTHPSFLEISASDQVAEISISLRTIRQIQPGPYIFCFPYNQVVDVDFFSLGISGAGFTSEPDGLAFNDLGRLRPFALKSQPAFEEDLERIVERLGAQVPDAAWVILAFHSFDGEGYRPWTSAGFAHLVAAVRSLDFEIVTVGAMIARAGRAALR